MSKLHKKIQLKFIILKTSNLYLLPESITSFTFFPKSDPEATSDRNMSPVDKWQT